MKFVYCQSYQVFNLALSMSLKDKVIVVSSAQNIIKACRFLKLDFVEHTPFRLKDMIRNKKEADKEVQRLVEILQGHELHFSHTQFAVFCFYLVSELNKCNSQVVFHDFELVYTKPDISSLFSLHFWNANLNQQILKFRYKVPFELRKSTGHAYIQSLSLDYIRKACYRTVNDKDDYFDITLQMFRDFKFDYPEIENLFVAQTFSNASLFKKDKIKELLPVINYPGMTLKNHPKLGAVKGLEECPALPDFIPVELFFQKVTGHIFSFHSASLVTASMIDHVKAISLLEIVKTDDRFNEIAKADLINKSNNRIEFIKSISELKTLLHA